jgi:VanZ family protein
MSEDARIRKWHTTWLASAWLLVGAVVYLSLARLDIDIPAAEGDKLGHVIAYAVLSYWFMQVYVGRGSRLAIVLLLTGLGIALEFAQGYTGYRNFEYADMVADAAGAVIGWIASPPRTPALLSRIERYISR